MIIATIITAGRLTWLLAWVLTRSIVPPLNQAVEIAESVASGDLRQSIKIEGKDEPARLLMALKAMQNNSSNDTVPRQLIQSNRFGRRGTKRGH